MTTITASVSGTMKQTTVTVVDHADIARFGPTFQLPLGTQGANGFVSLSAVAPLGSRVSFTSSAPSVVAAPPDLSVDQSNSVNFPLVGLASGTSLLTATIGNSSATAIVYVAGSNPPTAFLNGVGASGSTLVVGAATYGYANTSGSFAIDKTLDISFSTPGIVAIPGGAPVMPAGETQTFFPIQAIGVGTTDVTIGLDGATQQFSITVVMAPTLDINVTPTMKNGATLGATLSANAILAADVDFTVMSSDTSIVTVSSPMLKLNPGQTSPSAIFGLSAHAPGMATITVSGAGATKTAMVMVTP
jgi:hypothetical protein